MIENRSAPPGTVVPVIAYDDLDEAIEWLCRVFGFRERLRWVDGEGNAEGAELEFGDGSIMLSRTRPGRRPPQGEDVTHIVMLSVDDVDAHYAIAKAQGADVHGEPATHMFGERQYGARDFAGHQWAFTQTVADVAPEEWGAVVSKKRAQTTDE